MCIFYFDLFHFVYFFSVLFCGVKKRSLVVQYINPSSVASIVNVLCSSHGHVCLCLLHVLLACMCVCVVLVGLVSYDGNSIRNRLKCKSRCALGE